MPAFVLALVLLGALAAGGMAVLNQVRMAPGTLVPVAALASSPNGKGAGTAVHPSRQTPAGPGWEVLNTPQKLALYPLAERWALLSEAQKRRWLALAQNFPTLPEHEQEKLHDRMTEWASLSVQQRNQARLNYADSNRLARDNKLAQWQAYQALSDEEKRKLAARAAPKPQGAATALKPVSPRKLAQIPAASEANPNRPNQPKIPPVQSLSPRLAKPALSTPAAAGHGSDAPVSPPPALVETAPVNVPMAVPITLPPLPAAPVASDHATPAVPDAPLLTPQ
ncbi:Protein of unknown function [Acidovorax soli]|uniref:DUF3106 domain-containing protein n=2 Tax=Acidovorax soli TaxID=592050 RepID=A0A1H3VFA2_9BURK|nr:DUF3106 domain-containing protein [Acidovorax soli]SDZ73463.1 Protein of unknown function [Acidovorax soli]